MDQYPEMSDILSRYQTLKKFNQTLQRERTAMEQEKETLKRDTTTFEKQATQAVLQLSNELKDQSKKLEVKMAAKTDLLSDLDRTRDQYERKNLDLAKMLMAIDNLYLKCADGVVRVKHSYEEYAEETEKKPKKKVEDKNKKIEDKDSAEENNFEDKCTLAVQKIKSIFAYTKDYKNIIQEYRKQIPNKKT